MTIKVNRWSVLVIVSVLVVIALLILPGQLSLLNAQNACPPQPAEPRLTGAVMQNFEHGYMIWLQDTKQIYVLYDPSGLRTGTSEVYQDSFTDGMAEKDPTMVVPAGKLQPTRCFGQLWRTNQKVKDTLGWAVDPAFPYTTFIEVREAKVWMNGEAHDGIQIDNGTWKFVNAWLK